jgi:hypothetical protein
MPARGRQMVTEAVGGKKTAGYLRFKVNSG